MKAIIHTKYGPPEVAQLREIPKPQPKENEILIKVFASTVNRTDSGFRKANYFVSRFWSGLLRPKYQTLGCEFAGEVEAVGNEVKTFQVGDKIFGYNDTTFGGHAEYLTLAENSAIATIPMGINFEEAAALTEGAHYALNNIRAAKVKSGQNVLVYGASGAIGSAAVQLLKHFGATVTAVCGTGQVEIIKSIGTDAVIDYQTEDFTQIVQKFDFIFDAVGKSSYKHCKPLLLEKGIYISTELGKNGANIFLAIGTSFSKGKKVLFPIPTATKADIEFLKEVVEAGHFRPLIDRTFQMEEIVTAYKFVETGQKIGNVILKIR